MYVSFSVVSGAKRSASVTHSILFHDERRPEMLTKTVWHNPDEAIKRLRETALYEEFPLRDGGRVFVRSDPS